MLPLFKNYDYIILDLDDTLYPEIQYLDGAYKNIAKFIAKNTNISSEKIYNYLTLQFNIKGRHLLFDRLLTNFNINSAILPEMLKILRTFKPKNKILLYSEIYKILPALISKSKYTFVVTNGNVEQQKNKVKNINWRNLNKSLIFIYANRFNKKPSPDSFNFIKKKYFINPTKTIMIGDSNTDKDFAENCNINFFHITQLLKIN
jgi:putative hydrolase of the HAD superfamily